jgi:class 3 adenylate cyclase/streptogramin lyase
MAELPRGTVSLLFTDIEGSTQLQRRLGDAYQGVVESHRLLLERAIAAHEGTVVDRQTESFFAVFSGVRDAVRAAVQAQSAIADHAWPEGGAPTVRMGIHAGEPELAGDRYVGLAVSRAARICAVGHGGQVLLSSSAQSLLADDDRVTLRRLGAYRLKDFSAPEPIFQVVIDGRPARFPRLRAEGGGLSRRRWLLVAVALLVAAAVAGAVVALSSGGPGSVEVGPTALAVVDPKSNKVVDAIELGFKSSLIAAGEGHVWVVDPTGGTIARIDPKTHRAETFGISSGGDEAPFGLAVGSGSVWVAVVKADGSQRVREFGPDALDRRREIRYGGQTQGPILFRLRGLAHGAGAVWAIDSSANAVWRVDRSRANLADGLDVLSLAAGEGAVWVAGSSSVTRIDAVSATQVGPVTVGAQAFTETASIALGGNAVWFTTSSGEKLFKLDPQSLATNDTFDVGSGPSGVAYGEGAVWVTNSRDGTISRVDPTSGKARVIDAGQAPGGIVTAFGRVWASPGEPRA